jgi:hypothetical protein
MQQAFGIDFGSSPLARGTLFMDDGRIMEEAPSCEFFSHPVHEPSRLILSKLL